MRTRIALLAGLGVLIGLWILLVSDATFAQLVAGVVASVAIAVLGERAWRQSGLRLRPGTEILHAAARLPLHVLRESIVVTAALWRRLVRGEAVVGSFRTAH